MVDTKKKKYSQEDVEKMLWNFCLNHEEEYQRNKLCFLLKNKNVEDLVETNSHLFNYYDLGPRHEKHIKAAKWLNEKYNLDLE